MRRIEQGGGMSGVEGPPRLVVGESELLVREALDQAEDGVGGHEVNGAAGLIEEMLDDRVLWVGRDPGIQRAQPATEQERREGDSGEGGKSEGGALEWDPGAERRRGVRMGSGGLEGAGLKAQAVLAFGNVEFEGFAGAFGGVEFGEAAAELADRGANNAVGGRIEVRATAEEFLADLSFVDRLAGA